jgi:signal transduction histidine kinase
VRARDLLQLSTTPMHAPLVQATLGDAPARARFETLRRRIFEEMARDTARWRLTWFLLFNLCALAILYAIGESGPRFLIQVCAVAGLGSLFAARIWVDTIPLKVVSFLFSVVAYFAMLGTTGGLASPFLMTSAVTISAASILLRDPAWLRRLVYVGFCACFVALAILSRTPLGRLITPADSVGGWASSSYVLLALMSSLYTMAGVFRMGCHMTQGYERAALELAARREQICGDAEERTLALEGVAARLAHEVKNPLAAIKGLSTHMARNAADAKTAERLAIVAAEADRLQAIVDGFLSFSRGLDDLKLGPTRLHEIARELGVLLETRAQDAGVTLDVTGDQDLVVDADVRKVRQALLNLVTNAIQASPRGGKIGIDVARDCGGALLMVRDEGAGMTPEVLERIRKPYFTTKEGGTGLGVAVARGVVEQHGGRLEFKSAVGKGTVVSIRLPSRASPCAHLPKPWRTAKSESADRDVPDAAPSTRVLIT